MWTNKKSILLLVFILVSILTIRYSGLFRSKSLTILIYMNGMNDLHSSALYDFLEMQEANNSKGLTVLIQLGRNNDVLSKECGNWSGVKRFKLVKGQYPLPENALGGNNSVNIDANMNDPETLIEFIKWGQNYSKTDKYGLIFWDHGHLFNSSLGFNYPVNDSLRLKRDFENYLIENNLKKNKLEELTLKQNNIYELNINKIISKQKKLLNSSNKIIVEQKENLALDFLDNNLNLSNYKHLLNQLIEVQNQTKEVVKLINTLQSLDHQVNKADSLEKDFICKRDFNNYLLADELNFKQFENNIKENLKSRSTKALFDELDNLFFSKYYQNDEIQKFDFIAFDSCRMAYASIIDKLSGLTNYVLASQYNIRGFGFEYTSMINKISKLKKNDKIIVESIKDNYEKSYEHHSRTLNYSIINTKYFIDFKNKFSLWNDMYLKEFKSKLYLKPNRIYPRKYRLNISENRVYQAIDLFILIEEVHNKLLESNNSQSDFYLLTQQLIAFKSKIVPQSHQFKSKPSVPNSGINIYSPFQGFGASININSKYYNNYKFGVDTNWIKILKTN
ncbi:MAG: clostripain-related cysteine peptidase [bacterium]